MPASTSIESGSSTLFYQASAPVGWTKLTGNNDIGIRITNGTGGGTGGTQPFTTCFTNVSVTGSAAVSGSIGSYTLSLSEIVSHAHPSGGIAGVTSAIKGNGSPLFPVFTGATQPTLLGPVTYSPTSTPPAGQGFSHTHPAISSGGAFTGDSFLMNIKYADVIVAQRN